MTIIVCNNTPDAIRGMLKRWFIEPKPNVFVGSLNSKVRNKTIEYIRRNSKDLGMLIISSDNNTQGFSVTTYGETDRKEEKVSGHYLIAEKWENGRENSINLDDAEVKL